MYTSLGGETYNLLGEQLNFRQYRLPHHQGRRELSLQVITAVNHVFQTAYQQVSPAKAGDTLLQNQQALAWAKAFVWATSNGVRESGQQRRPRASAPERSP